MKGKKKDSEFISLFMEECISKNIFSSDQILEEAKRKILEIDDKIIEVEKLKPYRSKLLDIVNTFDIKNKSTNEDIVLLELYKIPHHNISLEICKIILNHPISLNDTRNYNEDYKYVIKRLIEHKVLRRDGKNLLSGDMFNLFITKVLKIK